jgi:DNA-binding response OmpR family regulator
MSAPTILVVDDEPHVTLMLSVRLRAEGMHVVTATDGEEALELASKHRPHLVVTDLQMPVMTGLELASRLREAIETTRTPVIMLTARSHGINPKDLERTNVRHLITKPFSIRELLARIVELIGPIGANDSAAAAPSETRTGTR